MTNYRRPSGPFNPPTTKPKPTPQPPNQNPAGGSALAVINEVGADCPAYDVYGTLYDMSGMLSSGAATITNLLKAGVSDQKIVGYLVGLIKGFPASETPGGWSYMNGWQQGIGKTHSWDTDMKVALTPKGGISPAAATTRPVSTGGPGPSVA